LKGKVVVEAAVEVAVFVEFSVKEKEDPKLGLGLPGPDVGSDVWSDRAIPDPNRMSGPKPAAKMDGLLLFTPRVTVRV
jgi:hypothetical protein